MSSAPTSLSSMGLYVPVHKRSSSRGSSRASSPAAAARVPSEKGTKPSQIYSASYLLSLRPKADESMKEKMRDNCPEVVMNRRMRKSHEFHEHQIAKVQRQQAHPHEQQYQQQQHQQHSAPHHFETRHVVVSTPISKSETIQQRSTPRRSQPIGRPAERRRNVLQSKPVSTESWRGMRITAMPPLAVV
ncbi:hypothetical protein CPB83DRAFT_854552 [Crepidotus variabilis]|uniref:Uncharacterized protein n=1 Tax=Crepidotus variabilis TaxID=179855 RepID=A0A9P6EG30_9AGAR|nr:hypothetical protein CPB83DRAFT_854552 [Crepidotus variabilis]